MTGSVPWSVYGSYCRHMGLPLAGLIGVGLVAGQAAFLASEWWLALWSRAQGPDQADDRWGWRRVEYMNMNLCEQDGICQRGGSARWGTERGNNHKGRHVRMTSRVPAVVKSTAKCESSIAVLCAMFPVFRRWLWVYGLLTGIVIVIAFIRSVSYFEATLSAATSIHNTMARRWAPGGASASSMLWHTSAASWEGMDGVKLAGLCARLVSLVHC